MNLTNQTSVGKNANLATGDNRRSKDLTWLAYMPFAVFPVALCPKAIQLALFAFLVIVLAVKFGRHGMMSLTFGLVEGLLFCFLFVYLLSILLNSSQAEQSRVFAAFNKWAIWMIAVLLYSFFRQAQIDCSIVSKIAFLNIVLLVVLSLTYYSGIVLSLPWDARTLSGVDWINGERSTRFHCFLEYSTLVAAAYFILFPVSLRTVVNCRFSGLAYGYCILALIPVVACSSRTGILFGVASTFAAILYINELRGDGKLSRNTKLFFAFIVAVTFVVLYHSEIVATVEELLGSRQGSTDTRRSLYEYTFAHVMDSSPVFGCGIKDTVAQFGSAVPVGSHSTYLGILYRTGVVGLALFLSALFVLAKKIVTTGAKDRTRPYRAFFMLLCCIFFLTEDIDGADWLLVCSLSVAGLLSNFVFGAASRDNSAQIAGRVRL